MNNLTNIDLSLFDVCNRVNLMHHVITNITRTADTSKLKLYFELYTNLKDVVEVAIIWATEANCYMKSHFTLSTIQMLELINKHCKAVTNTSVIQSLKLALCTKINHLICYCCIVPVKLNGENVTYRASCTSRKKQAPWLFIFHFNLHYGDTFEIKQTIILLFIVPQNLFVMCRQLRLSYDMYRHPVASTYGPNHCH